MLEAKDIMTSNVVCIQKDLPVVDAIRLMSQNNITGIPVVEEDMKLVGILSEQDVLRLFHTYEDFLVFYPIPYALVSINRLIPPEKKSSWSN